MQWNEKIHIVLGQFLQNPQCLQAENSVFSLISLLFHWHFLHPKGSVNYTKNQVSISMSRKKY